MSTHALTPLESKLVALAIERKQAAERAAAERFASDVEVIRVGWSIPIGTPVDFSLTPDGTATMSYPSPDD
jgi:hypothetical protein